MKVVSPAIVSRAKLVRFWSNRNQRSRPERERDAASSVIQMLLSAR